MRSTFRIIGLVLAICGLGLALSGPAAAVSSAKTKHHVTTPKTKHHTTSSSSGANTAACGDFASCYSVALTTTGPSTSEKGAQGEPGSCSSLLKAQAASANGQVGFYVFLTGGPVKKISFTIFHYAGPGTYSITNMDAAASLGLSGNQDWAPDDGSVVVAANGDVTLTITPLTSSSSGETQTPNSGQATFRCVNT